MGRLFKRAVVICAIALLLCVMLPSVSSAAGASGTIKDVNNQGVAGAFVMLFDEGANVVGAVYPTGADGSFVLCAPPDFTVPLTDATVDNLNGFVMEQPNVNYTPLPEQLGIYQHQPRAYAKPPNTPVDMVLPTASSFVLKGYKQDGTPMRWGDFVSTNPNNTGAQFMYLTNLDEEMQPAVTWPTYDKWARDNGGNRNDGFPSLVVDSRRTGKYSISAMYWNVKGYGKLCLRADNAGAGFDLPAAGTALVIDLNLELARTAISDLQRRQAFYEENITDENIAALISTVAAVVNVDDRLRDALQLRDRLELKAARNTIDAVREGTLEVTARDVNLRPVPGCTVTIDQTSHDFLFGANGGTMPDPADPPAAIWQKIRDAGFELAPLLPAWGFTEQTDPPYDYWGKAAIEGVFGVSNILDYGLKLKFTGSVWMQGAEALGILPPRTTTMTLQEIYDGNLHNQAHLLADFANDPIIWEVMNEPAATNTVGMPRDQMADLMNDSALQIKAANPNMETLINSPSEFDFGFRYQSYRLDGAAPPNDNLDANGYNTTYSDFLKQARTRLGNLDSIDTIGLQFYPGAHVSTTFDPTGNGEAPAFTPSWLVDTAERYNALFGKPVHITELSFPSSYNVGGTWGSGYWREEWTETTQADYAESVYTMMFANPVVHSVLWWDTPDEGAFVESGGLVRSDLSEKPSYQRIQALIASWTTHNEQDATDGAGQATLSGFGGDYSVTVVGPDGHTENRTAHIDEQDENALVVDGFTAIPQTTGLSPDQKTAGDSGFILTVDGTDFVAGSKVHWNGAERATAFVSATRVTATIPASDIVGAGTASVTVVNDSGESNAQTFSIDPVPAPTTTGLSPSTKTAGDTQFTLTVDGTDFVGGSKVRWNGSDRATAFVSATRLTATIPATDIATAGTASVTVLNPEPGGGTSNAQTFTINNPAPIATGLDPTHKTAGDAQFTLTVTGTNFVAGSLVHWNGVERPTTYVSETQLSAIIAPEDIDTAGTANVTVLNPAPGGDTSEPLTFTIDVNPDPLPTTSSISPTRKTAGGGGFTLTVNGTEFVADSHVRWNGSDRPTTYVSATQLRATIPASDIATSGTAHVTVTNPSGESNAQDFTIDKAPEPPPPPPTPPATTPTWYLAEGTSDYGFDTYINIENPNVAAATARVTYMTAAGPVARDNLKLPPMSQTTINPRDDIGVKDFSTRVECAEGKTIVVDRRMIWVGAGSPSQEGTSSIGITAPAKTWYLPEGSSKWGFETWLLIQNPNGEDATCKITYMTEEAGPQQYEKTVKANSRASFNMSADIGQQDASIKVESDTPVIPERAMYRNNRREGHDSTGTTSPARDYYLAEGTTDWGFTTYVLVQNPNDGANTVHITYMTSDGAVSQPAITIPANSRRTVRINDALPGKDMSTHVQGSLPLIAERAMYWGGGTPLGESCHDSIGMAEPHATFYLPDGETQNGYETWTLVQNPNAADVAVEVSYLPAGGGMVKTVKATVPGNSRMTFNMKDNVPDGRAAVLVRSNTSGKKIMVERAMYWNNRGAGTDTIGGYSD